MRVLLVSCYVIAMGSENILRTKSTIVSQRKIRKLKKNIHFCLHPVPFAYSCLRPDSSCLRLNHLAYARTPLAYALPLLPTPKPPCLCPDFSCLCILSLLFTSSRSDRQSTPTILQNSRMKVKITRATAISPLSTPLPFHRLDTAKKLPTQAPHRSSHCPPLSARLWRARTSFAGPTQPLPPKVPLRRFAPFSPMEDQTKSGTKRVETWLKKKLPTIP